MGDDFDSNTYAGTKRRIGDIGVISLQISDSVYTVAQEVGTQSPPVVSTPKHDQDLTKKGTSIVSEANACRTKKAESEEKHEMSDSKNGKSPTGDSISGYSGSEELRGNAAHNPDVSRSLGLDSDKDDKENSISGLIGEVEKEFVHLDDNLAGTQELGNFIEGLSDSGPQTESKENAAGPRFLSDEVKLGNAVEPGRSLEVKKKQLLEELEAMVIPGDCRQEVHESVHLKKIDGSAKCSLGIQVIDETALINSIPVRKDTAKRDFVIPAKNSKSMSGEDGGEEKKVKRSRRRAKGGRSIPITAAAHYGFSKSREGTKIVYSREAIEALRFANILEQRKMWKDLYIGLGPIVRKEYDELTSSKHPKNNHFNFDNKQRFEKKEESSAMLSKYYSLIPYHLWRVLIVYRELIDYSLGIN